MSDVEFSRPTKVDPLPRDGLEVEISANEAERAAVAALNDLAGVAKLQARFLIRKSGRGVRAVGTLSAQVTQTCVVSLEPFEAEIEAPIDVKYVDAERLAREPPRPVVEAPGLDAEDEPDPIVDGRVDLGALACEFLTLSLDPYPRKPGAEFSGLAEDAAQPSPFQTLGQLKLRDEPD